MHERLDAADVAALGAGNKEAWDAFVPPAAALIKTIARRVLGAHGLAHEAGEVVQEVFARLCHDRFRLLRVYDPARARLSTWLGVIASAAAVDFMRGRRPNDLPLEQTPKEALMVTDAPGHARVRLPPGLLSPRQALILSLLYEKDLTPDEVGALLLIDAQTVRSQRHKALAKLRAAWGVALTAAPGRRRANGGESDGN